MQSPVKVHVVVDDGMVYVQCSREQWMNIIALVGCVTHHSCTQDVYYATPEDIQDEAREHSCTLTADTSRPEAVRLTLKGDVHD